MTSSGASGPDFGALLKAASDALARNDWELAARLAAEAIEQGGDPHKILGEAKLRQGQLQAADVHLAAAAAAAPENGETLNLLGRARQRLGDAEEARRLFVRAGGFGLAAAWNNLGELEGVGGNLDASVAAYRKALDAAPDNATAHARLAQLLEGRHDLANAKAHAERALAAEPVNAIASIALARVLMREEQFPEAERVALALADAQTAPIDERAQAWAIVGEARDRLNDEHAAFAAFSQANWLLLQRYRGVREMFHPAHPTNVRGMTAFVAGIDGAAWPPAAKFSTPAPAFLIGFPRSGTTLLEQVLSSHSKIACMEEKSYLSRAMSAVLKEGDSLERIGALAAAEIETVRQAYWELVYADHPGVEGRILVDKQPLHIVLLPLINKVFPDAKIVFALRDPRDVVLSCYQQCFGMNVAMAQFLELERAADYYDAVMELMLTCREKLKLNLHQVRYRDVVADLESEARSLAAFLGVAFEPAMLRYDETARKRGVGTPSARQVINPIYKRSVGRWRRYARELAPVLPVLNRWAVRLGYEA